jgi:hypothetical protein
VYIRRKATEIGFENKRGEEFMCIIGVSISISFGQFM